MEVNSNRKLTLKIRLCTHKGYTQTGRPAGNAAVITGGVAVACRKLSVFLRCGAVPVTEFGGNIASLMQDT